MSNEIYTEDLSDILSCARERKEVRRILDAWGEHGLPADFDDKGVRIGFNRNSGSVFLVNAEYQCCIVVEGRLQSFYTSPYHGVEGFFDDLIEQYPGMHAYDQEWLKDIAKNLERLDELPALEAVADL
jgi:hypothetical protein